MFSSNRKKELLAELDQLSIEWSKYAENSLSPNELRSVIDRFNPVLSEFEDRISTFKLNQNDLERIELAKHQLIELRIIDQMNEGRLNKKFSQS